MDEVYMKRALELAKKGIGRVDPNPLVGAVIVKDHRIIGEGSHLNFGEAHAEVHAINAATEEVKGATMYVTLEPCSHYGKTPPCADLIVKNKLARVVVGSLDPNPLVSGKGIQYLQDAGIEVITGVLDAENKDLNKTFFKFIQTKTPFVVMKTAMTADGKIATVNHDSKWISNENSRNYVHQMRHKFKAIMVGVNTIKYDDPFLTARLENKEVRQPTRIILDTRLEISESANVVQTAKLIPTLVLTTEPQSNEKIKRLKTYGVTVIHTKQKNNEVDLQNAMIILGEMGINSILLEGGSAVNYSALVAEVVDEVYSFIAPKMFGGKCALTPVGGEGVAAVKDAFKLHLKAIKQFGEDVCLIYTCVKEELSCLQE